ncbi:hypothetical protein R1sor_000570 [Riccia sorocarpa]|uniref:Carboxypeptidase n=1 Tax=Riccia sorocarpa TaxID=122646 RepID=A0ABD3GTH9_9MARC
MEKLLWTILGLSAICSISVVFAAGDEEVVIRQVTDGTFAEHLIKELPGAPPYSFAMHSGYITVDESHGRALFYWFVEADVEDPTTVPLTLWLNGGPGCSSVGGGALSELGPFFPDKDGKTLLKNPNSWNKVSNLIFLESPAGVGFSYSNTSADLTVGDERTALDSYQFLLNFLKLYPKYSKLPFYVSGESYAGHYVPQLAATILKLDKDSVINFKGIAVGNAWTDSAIDNFGAIFYWWTHALISDTSFYGMAKTCNFSDTGPLYSLQEAQLKSSGNSLTCDELVELAMKEMGNINIYEIYVDVCLSASAQAEAKQFAKKLNRDRQRPGSLGALPLANSDPSYYDPCIDNEVEEYLNQPAVQKALHANTTRTAVHLDRLQFCISWMFLLHRLLKIRTPASSKELFLLFCSDIVRYSEKDLLSSVVPLYKDVLLNSNLKILIFSGDHDAIVPVTGSRAWISTLGLKIVEDWKPYYVNKQVAGYVTKYDKLTFATVRGAGHMVPYTQPERGLYLFGNFVSESAE